MINTIVFDFDGVLVESTEVKTQAYIKLFKHEKSHLRESILNYHIKNMGISRFQKVQTIYKNILRRPLSDKDLSSICKKFSDIVLDSIVASPWVEGAHTFIQENIEKYIFFIVSGTPQDELKKILEHRKCKDYFCEALGSPKTKEILLHELMKKYQIQPNELVYVGDTETDWNAARTVGIPFIWRRISSETQSLASFSGPTISSLVCLQNCLDKINSTE